MKNYLGGEKVNKGTYVGVRSGEFFESTEETNTLPGSKSDKFMKVPRWLPFLFGPVLGLSFVIFLPLSGIIGMVAFLVHKVRVSRPTSDTPEKRITVPK
jgi:hypothetical protein